MTRLDVVVAVRDEALTIPQFLERIDALALPAEVRTRVIFIEDSSSDDTLGLLRALASKRQDVAYASLVRGYGQGIAVSYGLRRSDADAIVMMDVDGSHPPEAIPELVAGFADGASVVQCVRRTLSDRKAYRERGASLFHRLSRLVFGVDLNEQNVFYRLVSRDVAEAILAQPRYWRYLRFPLPHEPQGATRFVAIDTAERTQGESKYDLPRLVNLALDGVLSLVSRRRARTLAALVALLAIALLATDFWPIGLAVFGLLAHLVGRDRQVARADALDRIEVREEAKLPPER